MSEFEELLQFLDPSARLDLKAAATHHVLGLTGASDGLRTLSGCPRAVERLADLTGDAASESVARDAALALINLSADPAAAAKVMADAKCVVKKLWSRVEDSDCPVADPACMALSNLTIDRANCDAVADALREAGIPIDKIVYVFCQEGYNRKGAGLHYLGPLVSNLSQLTSVRAALMDRSGCVIQRLLPFTGYPGSRVRRGGVVGAIRNCCFDEERHDWLLGSDVDILPRLLLPLAGPTPDGADPEEVERLPLDLQYLDESKKVEEDPDLRRMLLEAITQLCATRSGRCAVRDAGSYAVLKELHAKEEDRAVKLACENLVDILIKKEEEIGLDNYKTVEVPSDLVPQLEEMDKEYLEKD